MIADLLSDAALKDASSAKIFDRGKTYASSSAVSIVSEGGDSQPAIHAKVAGTKTYTTSVWINDGEVVGACDCPSAGDGWFCKHQVAVALTWRHRLSGTEPVVDEVARKKLQSSANRAQTVTNRREALQKFLHSLPAPALAKKLFDLAASYREIEREIRQWQKLSQTKDQLGNLKSLVTEILAVGHRFIPLREVHTYVRHAEAVLPLLREARERDAKSTVALSLHALRRSWAAMMQADDSNGDIGELSRAIAAEWVAALQDSGAQPAAYGDTYLRVQLEDPFGCFDEQAAEAAMGAVALHRYRIALAALWRQTKDAVLARNSERVAKRVSSRQGFVDESYRDDNELRLSTLEKMHLRQLEGMGDIDGALAVLREDLSGPSQFSAVTSLLEKHNRIRVAFANAELAYKTFPDDWSLQEDMLRFYERDGLTAEAYALRRRQFEKVPSAERFHQTLKAGLAAKQDDAALRAELMRAIEASEVKDMQRKRAPSSFPMHRGVPGVPMRDVSLRAQILCSERCWDEACDLVQSPAICNLGVLRHIALHLSEAQRGQSVVLLLRVFEKSMCTARAPYQDELRIVSEIAERLDIGHRTVWLSKLRTEFKAKRNFVRDLPKS